MKYGKIVLYSIGGFFLLLSIIAYIGALFLPASYEVERTIDIAAPPETIYGKVIDLKEWQKWNPRAQKMDSNSYKGTEIGKGAIWEWHHREGGNGSLRIVKATPYKRIETRLRSGDGEKLDRGEWRFERKGNETVVHWKRSDELSYPLQRIILWIMDPEELIGGDLRKGLENMKKHLEGGVRLNASLF